MGLGPVVTPSRIRIPSPPQKRTTFTVQPPSDDVEIRNRKDQSGSPRSDVGELLTDFVPQVPGQDKDVVRPSLGQTIGRMNGDMRTRQELPLLEGTAVHRVLEKVLADAAMVEQGVALAGCAVPGHRPTLARRADQESEQVALDLQDLPGKSGMTGESVQAGEVLLVEECFLSFGRLARMLLRTRIDAE